jgi:hypothetical protein
MRRFPLDQPRIFHGMRNVSNGHRKAARTDRFLADDVVLDSDRFIPRAGRDAAGADAHEDEVGAERMHARPRKTAEGAKEAASEG